MSSQKAAVRKNKPKSTKAARLKFVALLCLTPLLLIFLWLGYREIWGYFKQPQAIVMLGGSSPYLEREKFTAEFAQRHPHILIWFSSGARSPVPYQAYTTSIFVNAGVEPSRLHFDYQAQDTVTNFTTLVDQLQSRGIDSVYLITSDYHMRRAQVIGEIVLGSRGIDLKLVPMPSGQTSESLGKAIRDGFRAMLWLTTGHTGMSLSQSK